MFVFWVWVLAALANSLVVVDCMVVVGLWLMSFDWCLGGLCWVLVVVERGVWRCCRLSV